MTKKDLPGSAHDASNTRPPRGAGANPAPEQDGRPLSLMGLIELLVDLPETLERFKLSVSDELSVRYGNDAGWANVWRAVSVRKALG